LGLEKKIFGHIDFETAQGVKTANLKGTIDRIDNVNDTIRILDYKTGKPETSIDPDLVNVYDPAVKLRKKEALQAFLYAMLYNQTLPQPQVKPIVPGLVVSRKVHDGGILFFHPTRQTNEKVCLSDVKDVFELKLKSTLAQMFDEKLPFAQTVHDQNCRFCPYRAICQR
jgi:hypothetical protein